MLFIFICFLAFSENKSCICPPLMSALSIYLKVTLWISMYIHAFRFLFRIPSDLFLALITLRDIIVFFLLNFSSLYYSIWEIRTTNNGYTIMVT